MSSRGGRSSRSLALVFLAALAVSGCGVLGGDDEVADAGEAITVEARSVRVTAGEQFFDIDPSTLLDSDGQLTSSAIAELTDRVSDLSLGAADPTNAGVLLSLIHISSPRDRG